jgi:lipopolysaccharide export system permease protein
VARAQLAARHDDRLVEAREPDQPRLGAVLHQPVDARVRVERAHACEREARAHHVAQRPEPDHEHALRARRLAQAALRRRRPVDSLASGSMVAPRLLWRYILRDVLLHTLLGLFAISLLLVVQNVLRFVEDLVAVGVGLGALGQLMLLILPAYASYAIPTALLFGILLSFGRMSADGEIVAMRACGVSVPRMLPPALALGAIGTLVTAYMTFDVQPRARYAMRTFVRQLAGTVDVIEPGRFLAFGDRLLYVHAQGGASCPLEGILIGDASDDERSFYAAARCGSLEGDPGGRELAFVLTDGSIHFRDPDPTRYRRIQFEKMRTSVDISVYTDRKPTASDLRFAELVAAKRLPDDDPERKRLAGRRGVARRAAPPPPVVPLASSCSRWWLVPLGIRPVHRPLDGRADRDRRQGTLLDAVLARRDGRGPRRRAGVAGPVGAQPGGARARRLAGAPDRAERLVIRRGVRDVPPGYVVHTVADATLVFDSALASELVGLRLANPRARRRLFARAPKRGRGAAPSIPLRGDVSVILRRYQHGGLFGGLTGMLHLGPSRALEELHVTARAEASGAPVPHVVCLALSPRSDRSGPR